jgi:Ser/Thr protein kinase RdoA (MazF antagonist)
MADNATGSDEWERGLTEVLAAWFLSERIERVTIGVNRRVWRVGEWYLTAAWPDERSLIDAELTICQSLSESPLFSFVVPRPRASNDDVLIVELYDRIWWLTASVDGRHPDPTSPAELLSVAESLAQVHTELRNERDVEPVQRRRLVDWAPLACDFLQSHPDLLSEADKGAVEDAADRVKSLAGPMTQDRQLVHGDPSFPNLIVDNSSYRIVGLVDWQEAAIDSPLTDLSVLGNTIWQRSGLVNRGPVLGDCLAAYRAGGGANYDARTVLTAMLGPSCKVLSITEVGT